MRLRRFLGGVLLLFVCLAPAWALSDSEYQKLLAQSASFREADQALQGAWGEAKSNLTSREFRALSARQKEWLRSGRDAAARERMDKGVPKDRAYGEATMDQVVFINGEISRSFLRKNPKGAQGLYLRSGKPGGVLEVYWYDEASPRLFVALEVPAPGGGKPLKFQGWGDLKDRTVVAPEEGNPSRKLEIRFQGSRAEVTPRGSFPGPDPRGLYVR